MRPTFAFAAVAAAVTLVASSTFAHTISVAGAMSGPAESPPNASPGTGFASAVLDLDTNILTVNATFSGLTGNTTAAHIHGLTALPLTSTAGVAVPNGSFPGFPIGATSGTYSQTFDMALASSYSSGFITANGGTVSTAYQAFQTGLSSGRTYFNIHSSTFGGGEIRGFLVPEPATLGLVGAASLGVLARRRRA
jgi:hypothetical protein